MTTFLDLALPFPLFEAPASEASDYVGLASCRLCGTRDRHCFELGIGDALILACPACGVDNDLNAHDRADAVCRSCGTGIPFPASLKDLKNLYICYECLRGGKGAMTKDTELGAVSGEQAVKGVTHGVPHEHLFELLRTPTFHSWQGGCWLFCCKRPMTYLGGWDSVNPDDPKAFLESALEADKKTRDWVWDSVCNERGSVSVYILHCMSCGRHRATWDTD
jgi:uncharacterized protein CbrC (UPF0167 family)